MTQTVEERQLFIMKPGHSEGHQSVPILHRSALKPRAPSLGEEDERVM